MSNNFSIILGHGYLLKVDDCDKELLDHERDESKYDIWFDEEHAFLCIDEVLNVYDPENGAHSIKDSVRNVDKHVDYIDLVKNLTGKYPHETDLGVELHMWCDVEC